VGLIKAAKGAIGGMLADQWIDFFTIPENLPPTAALFPAELIETNAGRGSNQKSSRAIISNGSKFVVPEGYGLLLFQDGAITAYTDEPGGYIWDSEDTYSQSIFAGNSVSSSILLQSWERFKFGGQPGAQQLAIFVRLKELPNNKFGTQSEIYWDDKFFNTQVGAITRGTFSFTIIDPIKFSVQFVPATYLQGQEIFDFNDRDNPSAKQLLSEVVSSLAPAFSIFTNDPSNSNRITNIQQDSIGLAKALSSAVEDAYEWESERGIKISKVTILGIEYDENTKELLKTVQRADALSGNRGNANLQASVAEGIQSAGSTSGAEGILGIGIAGGSIGLSGLFNSQPTEPVKSESVPAEKGLVEQLAQLKTAFESGLISQEEFESAKSKLLGLS
jgi:membrane protease subunit (stomatin/prohibitin family)